MQEQLKIDFPEPEGFGKPEEAEPLFWVKEVRFLSRWTTERGGEIRRIQFRKGLNVVWSPPTKESDNEDQRISGHASGKTALCRMIRYVLGEEKIGTEDFRAAVTNKYHDGHVLAEIRLNGDTWCVARPFTAWTASRGVAARCESLDEFLTLDLPEGSFENFRVQMEQAAKRIVPFDALPDGSPVGLWHYFPWFTRDQEMQFAKLHAWREVDSPSLKQEHKAFLMRSIYNPLAKNELDLIAEDEQLLRSIEEDKETVSGLAWACKENLGWLSRLPDVADIDMGNVLLVDAQVLSLTKERDLLDQSGEPESDELLAAREALDRAKADYEEAVYTQSRRYDILSSEEKKLNDLENAANAPITPPHNDPPESQVRAAARHYPGRRYCSAPLDWALAHGCQEAKKYADKELAAAAEAVRAKLILREKAGESIPDQKQEVARIIALIEDGKKDIAASKARKDSAQTAYDAIKSKLTAVRTSRRDAINEALTAISRYREAFKKKADLENRIEQSKNRHKQLLAQLAAIRERGASSVGIDNYFFWVVRFVLGKMVVGKIIDSKDNLLTKCLYNDAPCSSAAIDAALNVIFDLTVLTMGIQGKSRHPRFLIHDGPRVADVSTSIYHRYFEFAENLENRANGNPNFQYIITTTEPPPERFRDKKKYLCLELNAATPEGRLLKCDLRG